MITESSSANHTAAMTAAIKGQICSLIDPVALLSICLSLRRVRLHAVTGEQVARSRTKKNTGKKCFYTPTY